MALSWSKTDSGVMGDKRYWFGTVTFDSSYPTGGESVDLDELQMRVLDVMCLTTNGSHVAAYIPSGQTLRAYTVSDGNQVANTTDLSSVTLRVIAFGY